MAGLGFLATTDKENFNFLTDEPAVSKLTSRAPGTSVVSLSHLMLEIPQL